MLQDLPHVISPLTTDGPVAGSNEIPIKLEEILPVEKRLSVTVGMLAVESGERVDTVSSAGPILIGEELYGGTDWEVRVLTRGYRRHHRIGRTGRAWY